MPTEIRCCSGIKPQYTKMHFWSVVTEEDVEMAVNSDIFDKFDKNGEAQMVVAELF